MHEEKKHIEIGMIFDAQQKFKRFLQKRVGSEEIAEDLLQQSLLQALKNSASLRDSESSVAWFSRIVTNVLTDYYRSRASEKTKKDTFAADLKALEQDHIKIDDELKNQICQCMEGLLPVLKPEYASIIKRVDLEEEPIAKVASDLGETVNNVTVRLHRARKALKTGLEQTCGACTKHGCLDCSCKK